MALRIEKEKERLAKRKRDGESSASGSNGKRPKAHAPKDTGHAGPKP